MAIKTKNMLTMRDAADFLVRSDDFLVLTHANPDGDTCGSAAALCAVMRKLGKSCHIFPNSTMTPRYLPFIEEYLTDDAARPPSTIIAVDIADTSLFTDEAKRFAGKVDLCIDHHPSNRLYASNTLLDPNASATGEIILDLVREFGVPLTRDIALPLYVAIATDTGCFRYSNTSSRSLRAAADLLDTGIDFVDINTRFFETKSRTRLLIEQKVNENMRCYDGGSTAIAVVTKRLIAETGAKEEDVENLSSFLRSIEGVEIAVLLREQDEGRWKISVRTSPVADASRICAALGGGGHKRAAGCTFTGTLEEASEAIIRSIETEKARYA